MISKGLGSSLWLHGAVHRSAAGTGAGYCRIWNLYHMYIIRWWLKDGFYHLCIIWYMYIEYKICILIHPQHLSILDTHIKSQHLPEILNVSYLQDVIDKNKNFQIWWYILMSYSYLRCLRWSIMNHDPFFYHRSMGFSRATRLERRQALFLWNSWSAVCGSAYICVWLARRWTYQAELWVKHHQNAREKRQKHDETWGKTMIFHHGTWIDQQIWGILSWNMGGPRGFYYHKYGFRVDLWWICVPKLGFKHETSGYNRDITGI